MATEKFSNFGFTTLNGGINNSTTSVVVTSAANFPATGNFRIVVDAELMLVTGVSSNTFTVTRGYESTSAVTHSSGAQVAQVVTSGAIQQFRVDTVGTGTVAARPTADTAGKLYFPNNGYHIFRDTGSTWASFGPVYPMTPPDDSQFSWINQGSATVDATRGGITLTTPASSGSFNIRLRKMTAPATPYTVTVAYLFTVLQTTNSHAGVAFRQSSDGKLHCVGDFQGTSNRLVGFDMSSVTAHSATVLDQTVGTTGGVHWIRLADNGTNRIVSTSPNGYDWIPMYTIGRTSFLTADEVGFFVNNDYSTITILSWVVA